jgi:class 3 adenylate cyclase
MTWCSFSTDISRRWARTGCREALAAARLISARLDELNASLGAELDRRIGIGIHCGPAIVGEMGYGNAASITAIGDAVNTPSRLGSSRAGSGVLCQPGPEMEVSSHWTRRWSKADSNCGRSRA